MKAGEFEDGARVLRAKVDMTSPNMHMRDPVIYRIKHAHHHRTGDAWCIYPMYDFAHGQSDSIEHITHSLCSLEFIHHRPLYNWFIEKLGIFPSRQIEFSRMNVTYMITSKRKLKRLIDEGLVTGWDDPRMSTVSGIRRKEYPAAALRMFCQKAGMTKRENNIEIEMLEACVREILNETATRAMVVLDPIKLTITNYPDGQEEVCTIDNNPQNEADGVHEMPFSKHLLIERDDFMEDAPKKFYRLSQGRDVRLKGAFIIHCTDVRKNDAGEVEEVFATYYKDSKSGNDVSGVKAKGTLHWVSEAHAMDVEVRDYERLYTVEDPTGQVGKDFIEFYNPNSLSINSNAKAEPFLKNAKSGDQFQFLRKGYYCVDPDSNEDMIVINNTVSLKEGWKK